MNRDQPAGMGSLPLSLKRRVDEACDRFEKAWKDGRRPRIEDYLVEVPEPDRVPLFPELLALEIELRCDGGERPTPEEYYRRFPEHIEQINAVFAKAPSDADNGPPGGSQGATIPRAPHKGSWAVDPGHPSPSGSPPAPDHIGRYKVVRRLGGGSFGDVYLAHDGVMDRQVAIKVPSVRLVATERAREEFLREARSAARLKHGGIIGAYDFGQEPDGRCYIVYEFVDGESLAERIKPGRIAADPLRPHEAARIVAGVAEALHYAHLQEMFHRDIKPANILLDRQGKPRVADFGLAVREEDLAGQRGVLAGTLRYMSPEQVRRECHHIDGRTDIYSLGVVLYELLCGRRPFEAKTKDELEDQILHREAKPPRQVKDSIPQELERVCLKALSKRVNERYTTARDMADELKRATGRAAAWEELGSPAKKLLTALASLNPRDLWRAETTHRNRESAKELVQEVTRLIEQFELQYDELMEVLSSSDYGRCLYGSAGRVPRQRLLKTNRKLVAIANEMRAIYRGITGRFILLPDTRATIDSITSVCSQIAVAEDFLVINGVKNSGELRFDLQEQMQLLDGLSVIEAGTIVEAGNINTGDGEGLLRDYHLVLLELGKYKIALKEGFARFYQGGLESPHPESVQPEKGANRTEDPKNLLHLIWDSLDPNLQDAFSLAYNKKCREGSNRISTRDLFQALHRISDDALRTLIESLPEGALPDPVNADVGVDRHLLRANPLLSDCVEDSLSHFIKLAPLPRKLSPVDIFVDIGQHGHGPSVARLRKHGVTPEVLEKRIEKHGLAVVRRRVVTLQEVGRRMASADEDELQRLLRLLQKAGDLACVPLVFRYLGHSSEAVRQQARKVVHALGWDKVSGTAEDMARRDDAAGIASVLDGLAAFEVHPQVVGLLDRLVVLLKGDLRNRTILLLERKRLSLELDAVAGLFRDMHSPYRIEKVLGQGLFAAAYLAHADGTDLAVVVRVLRPEFVGQPHLRARFLDLSKRALQLVHENLVLTREARAFPERQMYFAVRDYVNGVTLQKLLEGGKRFEPAHIVRILRLLLGALGAVHRRGMSHGGVKPSNVFVCEENRVVLGDPALPAPGVGVALERLSYDYRYAAPETFCGGGTVSPQSDYYSLGCVAYELACGEPPFVADNYLELAARHLHDAVVPPSQRGSRLGPAGDKLLLKLLARSPADRYAWDEHILRALDQLEDSLKPERLKDSQGSREGGCRLSAGPLPAPLLRDVSLARLRGTESMLGFDASVVKSIPDPGDSRALGEALPPQAPVQPKRIGNYDILETLGQGGMGIVYKALDPRLGRVVALKVLRLGAVGLSDLSLTRFQREAEATAKLKHPHIVPIYDSGKHEGQPFIVLEYVGGGSLAEKLGTEGLMPSRAAAEIVAKLARAVHHAHEQGVLHRDLKPSNVLLTPDGQPMVTDFGLAKIEELPKEDAAVTDPGMILGTPSYMAPEQAAGEISMIGPPADIYSLGAILYASLTGRPPFQGKSIMGTLSQLASAQVVPPHTLNPAVSGDLSAICLKCLAKDPDQRYASAQEVADELERFLRGEPVTARRATNISRFMGWVRRSLAALFLFRERG
jgi:serine/threonine protein kinase